MRVAVFGAGGYIGRRLVGALEHRHVEVVTYSSGNEVAFDPESGILRADFQLAPGTDSVVYLSQSPRFRQMPDQVAHLWGVNVVSALRAATLARNCGVKRFIYASTGNVYAPSFQPLAETDPVQRGDWYALSKVHAEEGLALFRHDMAVLSTRIFGVYGPDQSDRLVPNLLRSVRDGLPIFLAPRPAPARDDGGLRVSLCFVDDIVEIFVGLVSSDVQGVLNVAGPQPVCIREIATAIGQLVHNEPVFEMASKARSFDLVADTARLIQACHPRFTRFDDGLRAAVDADAVGRASAAQTRPEVQS